MIPDDEKDWEVHKEIVQRMGYADVVGAFRDFADTGTRRYADRRRHFKSTTYFNNKNLWIRSMDSFPEVILHGTVIVRFLPVGVRLSAGGWATVTTKHWLNEFTYPLCARRVYQKNYEWFVAPTNQSKLLEGAGFSLDDLAPQGTPERNKQQHWISKYLKQFDVPFQNDMIIPYRVGLKESVVKDHFKLGVNNAKSSR